MKIDLLLNLYSKINKIIEDFSKNETVLIPYIKHNNSISEQMYYDILNDNIRLMRLKLNNKYISINDVGNDFIFDEISCHKYALYEFLYKKVTGSKTKIFNGNWPEIDISENSKIIMVSILKSVLYMYFQLPSEKLLKHIFFMYHYNDETEPFETYFFNIVDSIIKSKHVNDNLLLTKEINGLKQINHAISNKYIPSLFFIEKLNL